MYQINRHTVGVVALIAIAVLWLPACSQPCAKGPACYAHMWLVLEKEQDKEKEHATEHGSLGPHFKFMIFADMAKDKATPQYTLANFNSSSAGSSQQDSSQGEKDHPPFIPLTYFDGPVASFDHSMIDKLEGAIKALDNTIEKSSARSCKSDAQQFHNLSNVMIGEISIKHVKSDGTSEDTPHCLVVAVGYQPEDKGERIPFVGYWDKPNQTEMTKEEQASRIKAASDAWDIFKDYHIGIGVGTD